MLAVDGAAFSMPANALAPGTTVMLVEMDPALVDGPARGATESRVTPIYLLTFSDAQLAPESMTFALDDPRTGGDAMYARLKTTGGLATEGRPDSDWRPVLGQYDDAGSLLRIELEATARSFLIAGLTRGSAALPGVVAALAVGEDRSPEFMADRLSAAPAAPAAPAAAAPHGTEWESHGWVVLCDPEAFAESEDDRCDSTAPEFSPLMATIVRNYHDSALRLSDIDFKSGALKRYPVESLEEAPFPFVIYDPGGRSAATSTISGEPLQYFVVWADPDLGDDCGIYYPETEEILNSVECLSDETSVHEVMHSVQRAVISNIWENFWIIEGLAAATEPEAPSYSGPSGTDYRKAGIWRDWQFPLINEDGLNAYTVLEFWLSLTGDLFFIPDFYDNLGSGLDPGDSRDSQILVDEAMEVTGFPPLRDAYLDLIQSRNEDHDYPYCVLDEGDCPDGRCVLGNFDVTPVSARCLDLAVAIDDDEQCIAEPEDLELTLETEATSPHIKLMVDGVLHDANEAIPFSGYERVWIVNTDFESPPAASPATASLVATFESSSCGANLLQQEFILQSSVSTAITEGSWGGEVRRYSYDDLSEASFHRFTDYNIQPAVPVETPIAPLGFEFWDASISAMGTVPGDLFTSASATFDTVTFRTERGGLQTSGEISTSAERAGAQIGQPASSARSAVFANYQFRTTDTPVELSVTWDCGMSQARVEYPGVNYHVSSRGGIGWECEPKQWTVPANRTIEVSFASVNYIYESFLPDEGGAYEIKIVPIEPVEP